MCKANDSVRIAPPPSPLPTRPGHIMCTFFTCFCTRLKRLLGGDNSIDNQRAATEVFLLVCRTVFLARFSDFPQLSTMPVGSAIKIIRFPHCGHTFFFAFCFLFFFLAFHAPLCNVWQLFALFSRSFAQHEQESVTTAWVSIYRYMCIVHMIELLNFG